MSDDMNSGNIPGDKKDPLDYYNPETGEFNGEVADQDNIETPNSNAANSNPQNQNPYAEPYSAPNNSAQDQNDYAQYGGNVQYKWNYDDYQNALSQKSKPPKKKNKGLRAFLISVGSLFLVAVIGLASFGAWKLLIENGGGSFLGSSSLSSALVGNSSGPSLTIQNKPTTTTSSSTAVTGTKMTMEEVVKAVEPSVVSVEIYNMSSTEVAAEGSGIIMNSDGYIITNEHVIDGADKIQIILSNGKAYYATLVGADLRTDLAIIKIDETGLTAATFGNSGQLNVGESVLAIGNPGGIEFSGSVTEGIVSALNRKITSESNYSMNCIQTDAPINPGNSGGALVNMYGQVVGITSSKISATGYEGMGFAIPINTALPIINSLIQYHYVKDRVKLGISVQEITSYQASVFKLPVGLYVKAIESGSDISTKGIKVGDIITKINSTDVTSYDQFYSVESSFKPGDTVTLTIYRTGSNSSSTTFDIKVVLAEDKGTVSSSSQSNQNYKSNGGTSGGFNG